MVDISAIDPEYIWELNHQRKAELRLCIHRDIERALITLFKSLEPGTPDSQIHPLKLLVIKTKILLVCLNEQQKNLD